MRLSISLAISTSGPPAEDRAWVVTVVIPGVSSLKLIQILRPKATPETTRLTTSSPVTSPFFWRTAMAASWTVAMGIS
ncbi:MAG: hypothetical protein RI897_2209 [Verrucomicrobiota bacterium]